MDKKAILSVVFQPAFLFCCRCDAGDSSGADKFFKEAADMRDKCKPQLAYIVEEILGNSMSDNVLDNLLQRSKILKELFALFISMKNNDRGDMMSAHYNLLTLIFTLIFDPHF